MNLKQVLQKEIEILKSCNIDNHLQEAEMLLVFVLKKPESFLYIHGEYKINIFQILYLKYLTLKRIRGYSIASITKKKEFYGYKFIVNKHTLIPRPETEIMVEFITDYIKQNYNNNILLIDVGTGTGCIPISIINELKKINIKLSKIDFVAIDVSKKALNIAKKNSILNKQEKYISFYNGNLLEPVINKINNFNGQVVITANLPYLTPNQVKTSPSIQKEPKLALVAGIDGLDCYGELFDQINTLKINDITLLCEIDSSQSKNISKLIRNKIPDFNFLIKKDLRGLDRLVVIKK